MAGIAKVCILSGDKNTGKYIQMKMPNFLIIGAAKSGTTSLYSYLAQHPQIYMSPLKEPHFFTFEGQNINFKGLGDSKTHSSIITDLESYSNLFQDVSDEIAIGEASTTYLSVTGTAERIKNYLPNIKLIAILRDPSERAYSSFLHLVRDGREKVIDFRQALQEEEVRTLENWSYLWRYKQMGFYYQQLQRYYNLFELRQIKVYLYEDLKNNPLVFFKDVFRFLEVDEAFIPDTSEKYNVSGIPRNRLLHDMLHKKNLIRTFLRYLVPKTFRQIIRSYNLIKPDIPLEIRRELIGDYQQDILKLQDLIQRDLSSWLI